LTDFSLVFRFGLEDLKKRTTNADTGASGEASGTSTFLAHYAQSAGGAAAGQPTPRGGPTRCMLCNMPPNVGKRHRNERVWRSDFARFVSDYGVARLAAELEITESAVYRWIGGSAVPHPGNALIVVRLASESGARLTVEQIYQHSSDVRGGRLSGGFVFFQRQGRRRQAAAGSSRENKLRSARGREMTLASGAAGR
jgi:hypothetical protein